MARDPWLRLDADAGAALPLAGRPGHGRTAYLRRQPARIVDGRMEGGCTGAFQLICGQCGDHPYLDYSDIPPCLQQIHGPYPPEAGLAAHENHLGLETGGTQTPDMQRKPCLPRGRSDWPGGWRLACEP